MHPVDTKSSSMTTTPDLLGSFGGILEKKGRSASRSEHPTFSLVRAVYIIVLQQKQITGRRGRRGEREVKAWEVLLIWLGASGIPQLRRKVTPQPLPDPANLAFTPVAGGCAANHVQIQTAFAAERCLEWRLCFGSGSRDLLTMPPRREPTEPTEPRARLRRPRLPILVTVDDSVGLGASRTGATKDR